MRQDERALLEILYRAYLIPLKKYAVKLGAGPEDVEDLVHETFITYYERYQLDWPDRVKTVLLVRILHSKWVGLTRKRNRCQLLEFDDPAENAAIMRSLASAEEKKEVPEQAVYDRELYREILRLAKKMKKDWCNVVILRILEGLSTKEASEILGISEELCRSRLCRARKELQRELRRSGVLEGGKAGDFSK